MNNFNEFRTLLTGAMGTELSPLQSTILCVNNAFNTDGYNTADFIKRNGIALTVQSSRLCHLGAGLEEFWELQTPDKQDEFRSNPMALYAAASKYQKLEKTARIGGR